MLYIYIYIYISQCATKFLYLVGFDILRPQRVKTVSTRAVAECCASRDVTLNLGGSLTSGSGERVVTELLSCTGVTMSSSKTIGGSEENVTCLLVRCLVVPSGSFTM